MYFCVYFHETRWSIVLLHCNVLVRIQDEDRSSLVQGPEKYPFCLYSLGGFVQVWGYFFLKCLVEFTTEAIWKSLCQIVLILDSASLIDKYFLLVIVLVSRVLKNIFHSISNLLT